MDNPSAAVVTVVGEVLVDLLPAGVGDDGAMRLLGRFGGSPANVAVGLARLGIPVDLAARLSGSGYGPWLRRHLEEEGVGLSRAVAAGEPATLAVVSLDGAGVASYEFYGPGSADFVWRPEELPEPAALAGTAVHTGSLATALAPGAGAIAGWLAALRRRGDVAVSYDPNLRPSLLRDLGPATAVVAPFLESAHLVKVSDEDLSVLHPGEHVADIAARWLDRAGPELVVVTGGARGADVWHRDGRHLHCDAPSITVADTVGAGDAFTAGLLSALADLDLLDPAGLAGIASDDLAVVVERAVLVAAITCGRHGADPPRRADLTA